MVAAGVRVVRKAYVQRVSFGDGKLTIHSS
jgi:hypothetical protein